jgi:hypothetical protein
MVQTSVESFFSAHSTPHLIHLQGAADVPDTRTVSGEFHDLLLYSGFISVIPVTGLNTFFTAIAATALISIRTMRGFFLSLPSAMNTFYSFLLTAG